MLNILKGIQGYTVAYSLIIKLKLWKYFFVPIIISVFTAIIISTTAYALSDNVGDIIFQVWPWDTGKELFLSFSTIIGGIVVLAIGIILYKHIIMAFSAPFMGPVSEKIEAYYSKQVSYSHRNTSFSEQLFRSIKLNFRNLSMELFLTIPLLLLNIIPGINILSMFALFLVQSYYAGFGNIDFTLERHLNYRNSIEFIKTNKGLAIGNGVVFMLLLLVPLIGVIIVLPLSVTAAASSTIKFLKIEQ